MPQDFPSPYEIPTSSPAEPGFQEPSLETQQDVFDEDAAKRTALGVLLAVFLLLVIGGAGVWYYFSRGKDGEPDAAPRDPNVIIAVLGGKVTSPDGAEIIVPPNALRADTKIQIEKAGYGPVTDLYHLKPDGLRFLKPVTVAIPYKISGLKADETPYDILLKYWLTAGRTDTRLLEYTVDEDGGKLKTRVNEL